MSSEQLKEIVGFVRQVAEHISPGATASFSVFEHIDMQDGFALSAGSGAALIYADVTDAAPNSWNLQISAAIAFDIPISSGVAHWVNEKNAQCIVGKYYYRMSGDGEKMAVLWENFLWSNLLDDLSGPGGQKMIQWVAENIRTCLQVSCVDAQELVNQYGGRVLQANAASDLMNIFVSSSG